MDLDGKRRQELTTILDLQFNQVIARYYYSRRQQRMAVRIDIDSKTIEGLGVSFSIENAKALLEALPKAIKAAEQYEAMALTDIEK